MTEPGSRKQWTPRQWLPVAAAVACMFAGAGFFTAGYLRVDGEKEQAQGTTAAVEKQRDDVIDAADAALGCGERPQVGPKESRACAEIQEAKDDPVPVPAEQVDYQRVRGLVDDALSQDPRLSESALLAMVRQVYQQNPPKDGESPTEAELLALIRQVYAENPPEDGIDGANGQNAFCFDNPDDPSCQPREGPPGKDGTPGADGQPPFAWTTTYPDGSREECRRADPFDPATPRYECQFIPAPEPTQEPEPTQTTGGGLLPGG